MSQGGPWMKLGSGMLLRMLKKDDSRKLNVICIVCRSKARVGHCRCETPGRWSPQPPKLA
jgi:hypothetical protein